MNNIEIINFREFVIEPLEKKQPGKVLRTGCDILEKIGVRYWLSAGTLLGFHRDGNFIPHDTDIDVEIFTDSAVQKIIEYMPFDPIRIVKKNGRYMQLAFIDEKKVIFDIYFYYIYGDKLVNWNDSGILYYPAEMFDELTTISFQKHQYPCPNPDRYCELRFGKDWSIPKHSKNNWAEDATCIIKHVELAKKRNFLESLLTNENNDEDLKVWLGDVAFSIGDFNSSKKYYSEALKKNKNSKFALLGYASTLIKAGEKDKAIEIFERFLTIDENNSDVYNQLGALYYNKGEKEVAKEHFEKSIELNEKNLIPKKNQQKAQYRRNISRSKILKIGFLAVEPKNYACPYIRLESPLTYLHEKGDIKYINLYNITKNNVNINLGKLAQLDIIIVQRQMAYSLPFDELVKHIKRDKTKIIYEADDLFSDLPSNHIAYKYYIKMKPNIEEYIKNADLVTVSTVKLKSFYSYFNNNIVVLPNSIDVRLWSNNYAKNKKNGKIRILFSGTITHGSDLQLIENVIIRIINEFGDKVTFLLWGNTTERLKKYRQIEVMQFSPDYLEYAKCLKKLNVDFAVVSLENNAFNQVKSHIKWLEYSICKIPGIYSNIGAYSDYIEDGKTGILVENTQDAWYNAIHKFIIDEDFRLNIGQQTYEEAIKHHTLEHNAHLWLETYRSIASSMNKKESTSGAVDVSIIMPVYNRLEFTKKCIDSIYKNTNHQDYEIILINNASSDSTEDYLQKLKNDNTNIKVIQNNKNLGFAKANNQGVEIAGGKYIVFLNNDTESQQGWLTSMLEIIANDENVGAVGSKLLYPDHTIQHGGVLIIDNRVNGDPLLAQNAFIKKPAKFPDANVIQYYQALTAACLLVKKSIFKEVGGFDEDYWNGYEDVDLCFKLQEKNYKLVYQPKSVVIHYESQSGNERFKKVSDNIQRLHNKWLGKITPDFVVMKDGTLQKTKANKILPYKKPSPQIIEHPDTSVLSNKFVSIILLTYNALEYTKKCVDSILNHTQHPYEIIFVDNGSTDGTKRYLRNLIQKHTNFKLIANKKNRGFAAGNNQGVGQAKGEYVMILNNDVLVPDGWLESMVNCLEKDEKIGMVGPLTNYISGRQQVANIPYNDENGFHEFAGQVRETNKNRLTPRRRIAGFAVLMRKSLYEEVNGLDESYGTGNFEDDDLCLKVQKKGYAIMVDESTFIHHYGSRTFKSNKINYKKSLTEKGARFKEIWPKVDYEELLELKNPLNDTHPKLLDRASEQLLNGNPLDAASVFEQILKENPISGDALFGLALCARQKNDNETALKHLKKLLQLNPNHAGAYNLSGMISFESGDLKNAKKLFVMAIEKDQTFIEAQRNFGEVLLALEDYDVGVQTFMAILKNHPDDVPALIRVAQLYIEVGQMSEAAPYLEKARQLEPNNSRVLELIEIMSKEGNIKMNSLQSEIQEEQQVEKDSRLENATYQLTEGNIEQANLLFSEVLLENPQSEDALFGLALCARQQQDNESALKYLNRLIKINPNCADAYNLSGMISFETGDLESSKMLFIAAIEKDHTFLEAQRNYGEVLLALEDYENGVKTFTAILEKHPENVPALLRMAQLYAEVGKSEEAGQYAAKVLEYDSGNSLAKEICKRSGM